MEELQQIRFYHLLKQNLIKKASNDEFLAILDRHIGFHSTDYLTPFFSLYARIKDFNPELLVDALTKSFLALRIRAFRGTLFVVHRKNYETIFGATINNREIKPEELVKYLASKNVSFEQLTKSVKNLFDNDSILNGKEILNKLANPELKGDYISNILKHLEYIGYLIRIPSRKINDKDVKYSLCQKILPEVNINSINYESAMENLFLKYISFNGPITIEDLSWWISLPKMDVKKVLERIKEKIITVSKIGKEYYFEKNDYQKFCKFNYDSDKTTLVNFLPYEDHYPKSYKERSWFINNETASFLYNLGKQDQGAFRPTIWVNGEIVGRWEMIWADKAKTMKKIDIKYINDKLVKINEIKNLLDEEKYKLENFINEKLIHYMME